MIRLSLIGVAAATFATLAMPSYAQSIPGRFANSYAQANYCADHEPGNPYNKETDYMGWSAWRVRGGWDATNDYNCIPSHMRHGEY